MLHCHRALLVHTLMRPRMIEIGRVLGQHAVQMPLIHNQQVVETFLPHRANPPLGEGVGFGCLIGSADTGDVLGTEDGAEGRWELGIPVVDQEAHRHCSFVDLATELAGLLRDPRGGRVGWTASEVDPARPEFNENEDIEGLQPEGFDRKKVTCHDLVSVVSEERLPTAARAPTL